MTNPASTALRPAGVRLADCRPASPSRAQLGALLAGAQVCLASLMVFGREALATIPANVIASSRLLGGCGLFFLLARASGPMRVRSGDARLIVICGALGATNQFFFLNGLALSTATNASILSTTIPAFTLVTAWVLRLERPRATPFAGMVLAMAGALILLGPDRLSTDRRHFAGNLLILLNCVSWSIFLVLSRRLAARHAPMLLAARLFAVGAFLSAPFSLPAVVRFAPHFNCTAALYLAFIVAIPTVAAYGLNQLALPHVESSVVATYWYLLPILGTVGAMARLGERPGLRSWAAGAVIGLGVFLSSRSRAPPADPRLSRSGRTAPPPD